MTTTKRLTRHERWLADQREYESPEKALWGSRLLYQPFVLELLREVDLGLWAAREACRVTYRLDTDTTGWVASDDEHAVLCTLFDAGIVVPDGFRQVRIERAGNPTVMPLVISAVPGRGFLAELQAGVG